MKREDVSVAHSSHKLELDENKSDFSDEDIREAFRTFDLDKNMFIGVSEIRHVLKLIGEQPSDEEIDEMIKLCDSDGSGQVSFDGFQRLFASPPTHAIVEAVPEMRRRGSVHNSEQYSSSSLDNLLGEFSRSREITPVFIRKVYRRFQQFDSEKTGRVGYSDFLKILETDDSPLTKKLFDMFDYQLFNEVEMTPFLINLITHSNRIKLNEKLKISFALSRSNLMDDTNSLRKSELIQLLKTFFMGFPNELIKLSVEQRVEGIYRICAINQQDVNDAIISFNQFMDAVSTTPEAVLPPSLIESQDLP